MGALFVTNVAWLRGTLVALTRIMDERVRSDSARLICLGAGHACWVLSSVIVIEDPDPKENGMLHSQETLMSKNYQEQCINVLL